MRDYLLLFINGVEHQVRGDHAFMPLSSYLRGEHGACGTKVVCEEGDCGACTVIVGRTKDSEISYRPINSCIQFMYQLDCSHVVTIEGLKENGDLNAVQKSMVDCHGAQCGFCTPGFVVAMCSMFDRTTKKPCEQDVRDALTGNLCRCTGYEAIINAGLNVEPNEAVKLHELYPSKTMLDAFKKHLSESVMIKGSEHTFFNPTSLEEAVRFKGDHPGTVLVAGGTDVCVFWNKRGIEPASLMSTALLPAMDEIYIQDGTLVVGGKTTLAQLEEFTKETLPEFNHLLWLFGSPQIRNSGTLAGNIANGSPIGDTLPFLFVTESELELVGCQGTRRVNINKFYKGYKQMDLASDELIRRIHIRVPGAKETLKLYKVSKRKNLDICAFSAAFKMEKSGAAIKNISIAYGGVAATVVRLPKTEAYLQGKELTLETATEAGKIAKTEITPISDVRGTDDFRLTLAENILLKFFYETQSQGAVHVGNR